MSDAELRADLAARDGHELIVELSRAARSAPHDAHVADILSNGPLTFVVDEVGVEPLLLHRVLERAVFTFDLAGAQHVGLAHEDVDLHGLAHVRCLPIGVRQLVGLLCGDGGSCEQEEQLKSEGEGVGHMCVDHTSINSGAF